MIDSLYLAWRYIRFHKAKTVILVASITLMVFLPAAVDALVDESSQQLRRRARTTPLLIGAQGGRTELVLNALYFESEPPMLTDMAQLARVRESTLAQAIPLFVQFQAQGGPIVGTNLDYFAFRDLQIARGRNFATLGECVLGHETAQRLELVPGDTLLSTPEDVFDLAGVYPLKMRVVGVLAATGSPDDSAVFVDVKTTWIIAGLGHGHQDLAEASAAKSILERDGNQLTANAAVVTYTQITPENADSFHFHGEPDSFPLTGVIAIPHDEKSRTLLMGRYQAPAEPAQIVQPAGVMDELLATILRVRTFILAGSLLLGVATTLSVVLVFLLSLRLRRREIATITKIGGSRLHLIAIVAWEILLVVGVSGLLATLLTLAARQFDEHLIRWLLLSI